MSDDNKPNISIGGNVSGGNVNVGGDQTISGGTFTDNSNSGTIVHGNQVNTTITGDNNTVTMGDLSVTIGNLPNKTQEEKQEINNLVEKLKGQLTSAKPENAKAAQKVADRTDEFLKEAAAEEPEAEAVEFKGNLLKKAAENIKDAMPTVLAIATQIVTHVLKPI